MKAISAHVTGFYRSSFHAYTTEVTVDGHRWRLGLRYSKFHDFYDQLLAQEKDFHAVFPPKGTLFFTPKPEERQEQLEAFLQQVLSYYSSKRHPAEMENLLCDLLKVPRHLRSPEREDDDVSTSTESVLDEPIHEPTTEKKEDPIDDDPRETTHLAETKAVVGLHIEETEAVSVKEVAKVGADFESAQLGSPVTDERRSVELTEAAHIALDAAESDVVTFAQVVEETVEEDIATADNEVVIEEATDTASSLLPTDHLVIEADEATFAQVSEETMKEDIATADNQVVIEEESDAAWSLPPADQLPEAEEAKFAQVSEETVKEDIATVDNQVGIEEESDTVLPLLPTEQFAAETKEVVKLHADSKNHLKDSNVSSLLEEADVVLPMKQSVMTSIAHECTPLPPQVNEEPMVREGTKVDEEVKQNKLASSGRASSWISTYLPKSLLEFFRQRCLKKTNLLVLCVALLLPMVLTRR